MNNTGSQAADKQSSAWLNRRSYQKSWRSKIMNAEINEILAAKSNGKPGLISAQARELLNLRRLPAMLNTPQIAVLLGLAEHDIPLLIAAVLLKPLGNPPSNAVKYFGTVEVLEMAGESAILNKIRSTVYQYWRGKNAGNAKPHRSRNGRTRQGVAK